MSETAAVSAATRRSNATTGVAFALTAVTMLFVGLAGGLVLDRYVPIADPDPVATVPSACLAAVDRAEKDMQKMREINDLSASAILNNAIPAMEAASRGDTTALLLHQIAISDAEGQIRARSAELRPVDFTSSSAECRAAVDR